MMISWERKKTAMYHEPLATVNRRRHQAMGWIASTHGVIILMTLIMLGMTIVLMLDYHANDLPGKWWQIAASSTAVGCGVWALKAGSTRTIRYWCGIYWVVFGLMRSFCWLLVGSLSGCLSWLPCVLLGLVVFARRDSAPYVRAAHESPT
jgi:hypothetical protein